MTFDAKYKATDFLMAMCPNIISFQSATHYYTLYVHYDLLGELIISKQWVRKHTKRSGINNMIISINILEETLAKLIKHFVNKGCDIIG